MLITAIGYFKPNNAAFGIRVLWTPSHYKYLQRSLRLSTTTNMAIIRPAYIMHNGPQQLRYLTAGHPGLPGHNTYELAP